MDFVFLFTKTAGRISRKTWWLGRIGVLIVMIILNMALRVFMGASGVGHSGFFQGLGSLILLAIAFVPYRALTMKRLHDRNRPENLFWVFIAPTTLTPILMMTGISGSMETIEMFGRSADVYKPNAIGQVMVVMSLGVMTWALVELGILKGDSGDNAHGPDPLAPKAG